MKRTTRSSSSSKSSTSLSQDTTQVVHKGERKPPEAEAHLTDRKDSHLGVTQTMRLQTSTAITLPQDSDNKACLPDDRQVSDTTNTTTGLKGQEIPMLADDSSTMSTDTDSVARHKYRLRRNKIFTDNSAMNLDFECVLRSYYQGLFAGSATQNPTPKFVLSNDNKQLMMDQGSQAPTSHYALRSKRGLPPKSVSSEDNALLIRNRVCIARSEQSTKSVRDNASRFKEMNRVFHRDSDHSAKKLPTKNTTQTQTFDYVLRSNHCLLKRKRSFSEKLSDSIDGMLRSSEDRQSSDHHHSSRTSDVLVHDRGVRSRRRVSFLEPEILGQEERESGDVRSGASSCRDLSCEGLLTHSEDVSMVKTSRKTRLWGRPTTLVKTSRKTRLWGRPTTLLLTLIVGIRLLYDVWTDHFVMPQF